jgi:hypothetical protein
MCATLQAGKSPSLRLRAVEGEGASLLCDKSTGTFRPLIHLVDRKDVFAAIHGLGHPRTCATRRLLAAHVERDEF